MEAFEALENEWSGWCGIESVAVANGTAAIHLGIESLRLPHGSEIILSDLNMIACPRAIVLAGMVPVFVDCTDDLLIDTALLADAMSEKTKAIMPVHIYGRRCNMDAIAVVAAKHGLAVIEDLAEAHGVPVHPATDVAAWSAYRNKIICAEGAEGGAVAFRNPEHAALARQLRCLGFTAKHNFMHVPRGHNYRMSNVHAELVLSSLRAYPENLKRRREVEAWYDEECPQEWKMPPRDAPWVYDIFVPGMTETQQDELVEKLNFAGIMARYWFRPMSEQEEFMECRVVGNRNAARLSREGIYLPLHPGVTREQVRKSFEVIRGVVADTR